MKEVIKKSVLYGLIGAPLFMISCAVSTGVVKGVSQAIQKQSKNVKRKHK